MARKAAKTAPKKPDAATVPPAFAAVDKAFARTPDITRGKMMSSYGLKVRGKIFAMYGRDQFVVKLPKQRVDELVDADAGHRFDPGRGRLMKEWVVIDDEAADWVELAREAHRFVKQTA